MGRTLLERVTVILLTSTGAHKLPPLHSETVGSLREVSSQADASRCCNGLVNMPTHPAGIAELHKPGVPLQTHRGSPQNPRSATFCSPPPAVMRCDRKVNKANTAVGSGRGAATSIKAALPGLEEGALFDRLIHRSPVTLQSNGVITVPVKNRTWWCTRRRMTALIHRSAAALSSIILDDRTLAS